MTTKRIKTLLIQQGLTGRELAKRTGYTEQHVSGVINGRFSSRPAREAIAEILDVPVEKLWKGTSSAPHRGRKTATA